MSRQIGIDCVNCKPTPRRAHTEFSLEYHGSLLAPDKMSPQNPFPGGSGSDWDDDLRRIYDLMEVDMLWGTHDGFVDWRKAGRCTDMGHASYAEGGTDQRPSSPCPFATPEEVWAFDPLKEYGITPFDELVKGYEAVYQRNSKLFPNQLCTGGYYKTTISGASHTFGWDMLLTAAADKIKFAKVLERYGEYTLHHARAWAQTSMDVYINHDDIMWTSGIFMHPDMYRQVIFPIYKEIWKPLKAAGKKILYCTDGTADGYWEDIANVGADGFIFEPTNDYDKMIKTFGGTHCIVGSKIDCRTMTLRPWEDVKAEIDATIALTQGMNGIMLAVGNHIPANISDEMCIRYINYLKELM